MAERYDGTENELIRVIREVGVQCKGQERNGVWTRTLKDYLCQLGHKQSPEYTTCGTGCDDEEAEWLFDLCWYEGPYHSFTSLPLVVESEWKNRRDDDPERYYGHILYDFQKLMVARADHRVMVFEQPDQAAFDRVVERLTNCISAFKRNADGDRYLFACWIHQSQAFAFRQYIAAVP
jgi:hypothetical protein